MSRLSKFIAAAAVVVAAAALASAMPIRSELLKAKVQGGKVQVQPAAAVGAAAKDECNGDDWGIAGVFDFYVFEQEWPAQFCSGQSYPLCQQPTQFMTTNLAIHGLWPNYNEAQSGHDWPQCCASIYGPNLNQTAINLLAADMHQYWPDEQAQPGYNTSSFWAHEWGKHGTCSGLDQYTYFSSALRVEKTIGTPSIITSNAGGSAALADVYSAYGADVCDGSSPCTVSLDCDKDSGGLNTVTTCWEKGTLAQIPCPVEVIQNNNCPDPVSIASF